MISFIYSQINVKCSEKVIEKGLVYAFAFRNQRVKKSDFRQLWIVRISTAAREYGMSYSVFMGKIHAKGIEFNRKALADLAMNNPNAF